MFTRDFFYKVNSQHERQRTLHILFCLFLNGVLSTFKPPATNVEKWEWPQIQGKCTSKNMCTSSSCLCSLLLLEVRELNAVSRACFFLIAGWFYDSAQIPLLHGTVHSVNYVLTVSWHFTFDSTKTRIKLHLLSNKGNTVAPSECPSWTWNIS